LADEAPEICVRGTPAHTRTLDVALFQAEPGRLAARGLILDLRKRGLVPMAGDVQAAGVIHRMSIEAALSLDGPTLESIRAEQPDVAFEPSPGTGGECCRDPVERIEALAGATLDADYARRLGGAIGGPRGCSHVLTLAQLLGSTALRALEADRQAFGAPAERRAGERLFDRSLSIDGVESPDGRLELALQLADLHLAPTPAEAEPLDRLCSQREIRIGAQVDLSVMQLVHIAAAERVDDAKTDGGAAWRPLDVGFLEGKSVLTGMARTLFGSLGEDPAQRPLLDALLNLAPAVIQCMPALTNYWQRWREARAAGGETGEPRGGNGPMGGMLDSCYMWRRDGALQRKLSGPAPRGAAAEASD
jgi:hypothetical protein